MTAPKAAGAAGAAGAGGADVPRLRAELDLLREMAAQCATQQRGLPISPYTSLYLPISPYISLYLPRCATQQRGLEEQTRRAEI